VDEAIKRINIKLQKLNTWCKKNGLTISVEKSKYIIFHKAQDSKNINGSVKVSINRQDLERVYSFKYLGIVFDSTLSFNMHLNYVNSRVNCAVSKLYSIQRLISEKILKLLINSYVDSIINYCIAIWAVQSPVTLNAIYDKVLRFVVNYKYPSLARKARQAKRSHQPKKLKMNTNKLLEDLDLLTVTEKRDMQLFKFVMTAAKVPYDRVWFEYSDRPRNWPVMVAPESSSKTFNRSIKYRAWKFWSSLPKFDCEYDKLTYLEKVTMIHEHLIASRSDQFVYF
jgi:hypothetical protein